MSRNTYEKHIRWSKTKFPYRGKERAVWSFSIGPKKYWEEDWFSFSCDVGDVEYGADRSFAVTLLGVTVVVMK